MAGNFSKWLFCFAVLGLFISYCPVETKKDDISSVCEPRQNGSVRLDADGVRANSTCGTIEGRVQVCEDNRWKNLCDTNWTMSDAKVVCRSLNYSSKGAVNEQRTGVESPDASTTGIDCDGAENSTSDCIKQSLLGSVCPYAIIVVCFTTDEKADLNCAAAEPTSPVQSTVTEPPSTATVTPSESQSTPPQTTNTPTNPTTPAATSSDSTTLPSATTSNFFAPPTVYYFIGGLCAVLIAVFILVILLVICCCCGHSRRKDVSPAVECEKGLPQEEGNKSLHTKYLENSDSKDDLAAHHQLQQSGPIYEAIPSNESSSTISHDSPSARAVVPPADPTLYSTLEQAETYAQITPHIDPPTPTADTPNPDLHYQELQHKSSSLKRENPNKRQLQASNIMALALAEGRINERDLSDLESRNSHSLPRSLPSHPPPVSGSLKRPHLEQVQLRDVTGGDGNEENFYHILEPNPPPNYDTLGKIDEESLTAISHNAASQQNGSQHPSQYNQHSPLLAGHFTPNTSRSATLPGTRLSPQSSRGSSSSGSLHIARSSESPLMDRVGGGQRAPTNKYTESPVPSKKFSGSPQAIRSAAMPNRLSGQSVTEV